jgi:hypothetical protein
MTSLSGRGAASDEREPDGSLRLKSSAEFKLRHLKADLVWQLFSRSGSFWNEVRDMRGRWNIEPETNVPPGNPIRPAISEEFAYYPSDPDDMEIPEINHWEFELDMIKGRHVPAKFSLASRWREFLSACVLYEPPELGLVQFAECGGMTFDVGGQPDGDVYEMVASPVRRMPDPFMRESLIWWFHNAVMSEINEKHLKPRGLNIYQMYSDVGRNSGLYDELQRRRADLRLEHYIEVDHFTTYEDVEAGFKIIAAEQGRKREGPSGRKMLVAVECALLYDQHNATDPKDKRRRRWTQERLAERYGLKSARAAKEHIAYGRELLAKI